MCEFSPILVKRGCSSLECVLDELRGKNCSIFPSQTLKMALFVVIGPVRGKKQFFFAFHLLAFVDTTIDMQRVYDDL